MVIIKNITNKCMAIVDCLLEQIYNERHSIGRRFRYEIVSHYAGRVETDVARV